MKLSFHIEYRTHWGEEVKVQGSVPELGRFCPQKAFSLHTIDGTHWTAETEVAYPANGKITYRYHIYRKDEITRSEWDGLPRTLWVSDEPDKKYRLEDAWKDLPAQPYFYTSAFTNVFFAHPNPDKQPEHYPKGLLIKVSAPTIGKEYCIGVTGNQEQLGYWNPEKARILSDVSFPEWQVELDAAHLNFPLEYKFVLLDRKTHAFIGWENNPNRCLAFPDTHDRETWVIGDRYATFGGPVWKAAGTAIPVFSLRSEGSFGIGDFGDLKLLVDWAAATHQKVVQLLPVNDTTRTHRWADSYPYNGISNDALHPLYADLRQMGKLNDPHQAEEWSQRQKQLNALPHLDYEAVDAAKWKYLKLIYRQEGKKVLGSKAYRAFFQQNREWLEPYAAFCYLRDTYQTARFEQWNRYARYRPEVITQLTHDHPGAQEGMSLYYYLQYELHRQLLAATRYAHARGVALKGDIPIGIGRESVETWIKPHLFRLDRQTGAPPDRFSERGQNWGFPTYDWAAMEADHFDWWTKRLKHLAVYFDAYRLDHILGFFRIWEIPADAVHGLLGHFSPALPLSADEIASYGLHFREERFTTPFIHADLLPRLFGEQTERVIQTYLTEGHETGVYRLKEAFDTEQKVVDHFKENTDEAGCRERDGLLTLLEDVLFVRDPDAPHRFHPRVHARNTYLYGTLSPLEAAAFDRLYEDFYYHRHNELWRQEATKKLEVLTRSTPMLPCGEDLGMIPECVPAVMQQWSILSLEIQRMPKQYGVEFGRPDRYPYLSVSTLSTHDMPTLRGWWEENPDAAQRYYHQELKLEGKAPSRLPADLCEEIVQKHLEGTSMWCILSLQDWLSMDEELRHPLPAEEQINDPADAHHNWKYRMHVSLERLLEAKKLTSKIKQLITHAGR